MLNVIKIVLYICYSISSPVSKKYISCVNGMRRYLPAHLYKGGSGHWPVTHHLYRRDVNHRWHKKQFEQYTLSLETF